MKVLQNDITLTINGINSSQQYKTKLVQFSAPFGEQQHVLEALCLPKINISLKLPGLTNVVKAFIFKGFNLADSFLEEGGDEISQLDMILGTKGSHCLPETEIVYGSNGGSVYSETSLGIVLKGDIQTLLNNVDHLQFKQNRFQGESENSVSPTTVFLTNIGNCNKTELMELPDICAESAPINIINEQGKLLGAELTKATDEILNSRCSTLPNYDRESYKEDSAEINDRLVNFVLN